MNDLLALAQLDMVVMVIYFIGLVGIGIITRRVRSFSDFAIARHRLPAAMIFASLAATIVGPGFSLGFAAKGYESGYLFFLLATLYSIQTILTGALLSPKLNAYRGCTTLGDVMHIHYGKTAHILTGVISVGLLIGFTAIMGKVGGETMHAITGIPAFACIVVVTGTTALLSYTGGLNAVVAAEALQFVVFSVIVPLMVLLAFWKSPASAYELSAIGSQLTASAYTANSALAMFGVALSFLLGECLLPPYANRALAAASPAASRSGFIMAGLYVVVWLGGVSALGIVAHTYSTLNSPGDSVFLAMGRLLLPVGMYGLLIAAILAIVMSSQEAVLNSGAVALVKDIIRPIFPRTADKSLKYSRYCTLAIAFAAMFLAQFSPSIIDGLLILYGIWAPAILLPLICALFGVRGTPMSGVFAIVLGAATSISWTAYYANTTGVPPIVAGLTASAIGFVAGRLIGTSHRYVKEVES